MTAPKLAALRPALLKTGEEAEGEAEAVPLGMALVVRRMELTGCWRRVRRETPVAVTLGGGGSSSGGLSLGADGGGDLDALDDGGGGGSGGSRGGLSGASLGSGGGAGAGASGGGETELGGVLVLAGTLDNEEETVVGDVGLEVGAGGPLELSAVGDGLSESLEGNDVGGGTAQEDQGDGTSGGGGPLDGVGLALGNDLVQAGRGDGIAGRVLGVVRSSVGSRQTHEGGENGGDGETHGDLVSRLTKSD